jgi:alkylation response protein AidB-like acyl-CoA dehydrogenase
MGQYNAPLARHALRAARTARRARPNSSNLPAHAEIDADYHQPGILEEGAASSLPRCCSRSTRSATAKAASSILATHAVSHADGFQGGLPASSSMAGWPALTCDPEYGGQGLPIAGLLNNSALLKCSTRRTRPGTMYPGLSHGAYECLHEHGTPEQKELYLPKLVSTAQWTGTMCLTEPHCGTDLGLLRSKALPQADGSYRITGTKIFISAGEHDITENIHSPGAGSPARCAGGTKGISLFIVPEVPSQCGRQSVGERNKHPPAARWRQDGHPWQRSTCQMNLDDAPPAG